MSNKFEYRIYSGAGTDNLKIEVAPYGEHISVGRSTFGNCQTFTIGYFNQFISATSRKNRYEELIKIKTLAGVSKPLMIIDVKSATARSVEKDFKVISSTPYRSSNGSSMKLMVIDTRKPFTPPSDKGGTLA